MGIPVIETRSQNLMTGGGTSQVLTNPAGTWDAEDLYVVIVSLDGTGANPTCSDSVNGSFVRDSYVDEGSNELAIFTIKTASAPGTVTVSWTGSEQGNFQSYRVSGCASVTFTQAGTTNSGAGTTATALGLTAAQTNNLLLGCTSCDRRSLTFAAGNSWAAEDNQQAPNNNGTSLVIASKDVATAVATLDTTSTLGASDGWCGAQIALLGIVDVDRVHWQGYQPQVLF